MPWIRVRLGLGILCLSLTGVTPSSAGPAEAEHLKEGARSLSQGHYKEARKHLIQLVSDKGKGRPLLAKDYALYYLGETEMLLGMDGADPSLLRTAITRFEALGKMPQSRLEKLAHLKRADCLFLLGDFPKAKAAYQEILKKVDKFGPAVDLATVRFHLAEIYDNQGQKDEARAERRRLAVESPLHPLATSEKTEADPDKDPKAAPVEMTPKERLDRARVMIQHRRWGEALVELEALTKTAPSLPQDQKDEADYLIGTAHYKMRRGYDIAAQKLLSVAPRFRGERQADAMFHGARALSRSDQDDKAIVGYREVVKAHPSSRYAAEASFLAGWLEYNRGRYKEAIPALLDTIRRYPGRYGDDARWYLGFSRYLMGDLKGALVDLQVLVDKGGQAGDKARYFMGKALLSLARKDEAIEFFRKGVYTRPLSYYALLCRLRLKELGVEVPPFEKEAQPAELAPFAKAKGKGEKAKGDNPEKDPLILLVDELLQAGLATEAATELRQKEQPYLARYGAKRALPILADRYTRGESFQRPHFLAEEYYASLLRVDPHGKNTDVRVRKAWEQMYPLAYQPLVEKYAPIGDNPPRYLYTIMQKESAYNPHDVSYADAIGLLQMIPPTSRRVATQIGRPYTEDVLYDPEGNIHFGSWYIGRLLKKFKGQIALGAGSYNAGPKAMTRWLSLNGKRPLDEFIELCAYTQTREYMKKVLDIYAHYVYLWDKEAYLPSLTIDPEYLSKDGIDY